MRVEHLPCGVFANHSEEVACRAVNAYLRAQSGVETAYVLTNLAHGLKPDGQPDEIDIVVLTAGGAAVIEVKHWEASRLKTHAYEAERNADRLTEKTKRVASRLRRLCPEIGFVSPSMLLTKGAKSLRRDEGLPMFRGVRFYGVDDLDELFGRLLAAQSVVDPKVVAKVLAPHELALARGELKRLGRYVQLKRLSPDEDHFVRVYSAQDGSGGDRVTIYLYDLSASSASNAGISRGGNSKQYSASKNRQRYPVWLTAFKRCPTTLASYSSLRPWTVQRLRSPKPQRTTHGRRPGGWRSPLWHCAS